MKRLLLILPLLIVGFVQAEIYLLDSKVLKVKNEYLDGVNQVSYQVVLNVFCVNGAVFVKHTDTKGTDSAFEQMWRQQGNGDRSNAQPMECSEYKWRQEKLKEKEGS